MNRNIINQMDPQTRKKYDSFEKMARKSTKHTKRNNFISLYIFALNVFWLFLHSFDYSFLIAAVLAIPAAYAGIYFMSGGKRYGKMIELERRGDASDEIVQLLYDYSKDQNQVLLHESYITMLGFYHNMRGEYNQALKVLSEIPPTKYIRDPVHGNMYFSALLEAYSAMGDFENADKVYEDGYYYMSTYLQHEDSSIFIRMPLAIYENHRGNYKLSIMLLEDGIKMGLANTKASHKLFDEMLISKAVYLIAQSYYFNGERENALKALKQTEGKQCTAFVRSCIDKLYNELNYSDSGGKLT